jgi:hypothetical protein
LCSSSLNLLFSSCDNNTGNMISHGRSYGLLPMDKLRKLQKSFLLWYHIIKNVHTIYRQVINLVCKGKAGLYQLPGAFRYWVVSSPPVVVALLQQEPQLELLAEWSCSLVHILTSKCLTRSVSSCQFNPTLFLWVKEQTN